MASESSVDGSSAEEMSLSNHASDQLTFAEADAVDLASAADADSTLAKGDHDKRDDKERDRLVNGMPNDVVPTEGEMCVDVEEGRPNKSDRETKEQQTSKAEDEQKADDVGEKNFPEKDQKSEDHQSSVAGATTEICEKNVDRPPETSNNQPVNGNVEEEPEGTETDCVVTGEIKTLAPAAASVGRTQLSSSEQMKANVKPVKTESKGVSGQNYRSVAKLLINIGLELVREDVIRNLVNIQKDKDKQSKLDDKDKVQLEKLEDSLKVLVKKNEVYTIPVRFCRCNFAAFTENTLDLHRQFGHGLKPGKYRCCYCSGYKTRVPANFVTHMGKVHKKFARLTPLSLLQCPYCPFEHKQATHVERHVNSCQKRFSLSRNLVLSQNVFDIPVFETFQKPKVIPVQPAPALRSNAVALPRPGGFSGVAGVGKINPVGLPGHTAVPNPVTGLSVVDILAASGLSPQIQAQVLSNLSLHSSTAAGAGQGQRSGFPVASAQRMAALPLTTSSAANWIQFASGVSHQKTSTSLQRTASPQSRSGSANLILQRKPYEPLGHRPLFQSDGSRLGQTIPTARPGMFSTRMNTSVNSLKCEICDQQTRDLESLRLHLIAVHREQLGAEEFYRRGPVMSCPICLERFWTKDGVLRHTQMRHSASAPRPYSCIKCGAKVATSILNHLSSQHNITVLDMYEAKYCMLCNTSLKSPNLFEAHVVTEHSDIFPNRLVLLTMIKALNAATLYKTMGKPDSRPSRLPLHGFGLGQLLPRGMMDAQAPRMERPGKPKVKYTCHSCCINFMTPEDLSLHCEREHIFKCSRCPERFSTLEDMQRHFTAKHHMEKDPCILCSEMVQIGRPTVRHIKRMHIRECSVVVRRLRPQVAMRYLAKRRRQLMSLTDTPSKNSVATNQDTDGSNKPSTEKDANEIEEVMEVDGETIIIKTND